MRISSPGLTAATVGLGVVGALTVTTSGAATTTTTGAQTFNASVPLDHNVVRGQDRYYQIWFGHRMAYVRAADVHIAR